MAKNAAYWAVIWADDRMKVKENPQALRLAHGKTESPIRACLQCFGMACSNMWVKNLGTQIAPLRVDRNRREMLDPASKGWVSMESIIGKNKMLTSESLKRREEAVRERRRKDG